MADRNTGKLKKLPTYIILGSGGHTAEMSRINKALLQFSDEQQLYAPFYYLVASTDKTSRQKIINVMSEIEISLGTESFIDVPRSRHVGQSWVTTIFSTLWALIFSFWLVWRDQPQLVLCNGPGTCVPFCIAAYWWRLVGRLPKQTKIVFVESYCRVRTMSLSGRLLQPVADLIVVQWQALADKYKHKANVKYFGRLM